MSNNPFMFSDGRMRPEQAAAYLGFKKTTLANWRVKGDGPRFIKAGSRVFYLKTELDIWLARFGECQTTAQANFRSDV